MKHWPGSAPSTTPSTATGGVARSIDWSRSSTPAGPRVAAADHLRRPGFAPDLREGHPVCGRRVRRSAATPVRSVSRPAPSALAVRSHCGIENRDHYVRDVGEDDSRIRQKPGAMARIRSAALNILRANGIILRANGIQNVSQALYINALNQRPQLRQATRARILITRTEWPCR